jgi:hypothetical protein
VKRAGRTARQRPARVCASAGQATTVAGFDVDRGSAVSVSGTTTVCSAFGAGEAYCGSPHCTG